MAVAFRGEAAAQPGEQATAERALSRAADCGYLVADARREAFVQGFLDTLIGSSPRTVCEVGVASHLTDGSARP